MRSKCKCSEYQLAQVGCGCEPFDSIAYDVSGNGHWIVQIELDTGERFDHYHVFDTQAVADRFAAKVATAGEVNPDYWNHAFPRYGSQAFIRDENEAVSHIPMLQSGRERLEDLPRHIATLL